MTALPSAPASVSPTLEEQHQMVAIVVSKGGDLTFRRPCSSADGVIHGEPLAPSQADASRQACVLPPTAPCQLLFCFISDRLQMSAGTRKGKEAAPLGGGHAEVKDHSILRALPAVAASHFSSTQRQGREWVRTPVTLMSPRLAMRSS